MKITEVVSRCERRDFIEFPKQLYHDDPFWVCPLDSMIESVFDPLRNHLFRQGEAKRWILRDANGKIAGRIAAFIDRQRSAAQAQPTGGIGFFEVIDDQKAAFMLFDTAREWLSAAGMEAIDGPVNFGENDNNWGLLVDGFELPVFGMPYNKKYYRVFFETYGFRNYFEQYSQTRVIRDSEGRIIEFPERIMKIAGRIATRPGYSFRHFEFRDRHKFSSDMCEIYNSTWVFLKEDFTPLDPAVFTETMKQARIIIDEELIWFAYHNEKPIGFFILLPDLNQILRHFNGRLSLWNMVRFLYYKYTHEIDRARAIVGGIHHSYQNSGIESALFYHFYQAFKKRKWLKSLEFAWVGDYNPKMMALYSALDTVRTKTHVTYRYLINDKLQFVRYKDERSEAEKNREAMAEREE